MSITKVKNKTDNVVEIEYLGISVQPNQIIEIDEYDSELTELIQDGLLVIIRGNVELTPTESVDASVDSSEVRYTNDEIDNLLNGLIDGAPEALNTLKELATAVDDNRSIYDDIVQSLSNRSLIGHVHNTVPPHNHDNLYYFKNEVDSFVNNHSHNNDYYTKYNIDNILTQKSDTDHLHNEYYTQDEVDTLISHVSIEPPVFGSDYEHHESYPETLITAESDWFDKISFSYYAEQGNSYRINWSSIVASDDYYASFEIIIEIDGVTHKRIVDGATYLASIYYNNNKRGHLPITGFLVYTPDTSSYKDIKLRVKSRSRPSNRNNYNEILIKMTDVDIWRVL